MLTEKKSHSQSKNIRKITPVQLHLPWNSYASNQCPDLRHGELVHPFVLLSYCLASILGATYEEQSFKNSGTGVIK